MALEQAIVTGAFGLGGVAVGAATTSWVEWNLFSRRQEAEQQRGNRERAVRVRQAARLVMEDFSVVSAYIRTALDSGQGVPRDVMPESPLPNWHAYQSVLALEVDDVWVWRALADGAAAARYATYALALIPLGADIPNDALGALAEWQAAIDKTAVTLASYASIGPSQ